MISQIQLIQDTDNLKSFSLDNPPSLMVIAGTNGAGKTAFLNLMNHCNSGNLPAGFKVASTTILNGKVKYIPVGFVPGDIAQGNQNPRQLAESRASNVVTYISKGLWNNQMLNNLSHETLQRIDPTIQKLDIHASNIAKSLTESEILDALPNDFALMVHKFANNEFIAEVCVTYSERIKDLKIKMYDAKKQLTEEELYSKIGSIPPWVEVNELFEKYGFGYRLTAPVSGVNYVPKFEKQGGAVTVQFNSLSSGEKILVTLVLWAFNSHQSNHTSLFLLDEFDAHLNPSLAKMMMEIITDTLINKYGLRVIMTTHSPSTVAFTNDQSIFWMEYEKPIRSATKAEIIPILSNGFITVQPDKALGLVGVLVDKITKPILCVEGFTDREILTTAWQKLNEGQELPFEVYDAFDCYFLSNMFKRGDIFKNYPNHTFFGLLDFDSAYSDAKEKLPKLGWTIREETNPAQVVFSHPKNKGVLFTLPVPEERKDYAGLQIKNSYLSIELLFTDEIVAPFCTTEHVAGGAQLLKFKDSKKADFANYVQELDANEFMNFKPLFEKLIELTSSNK